MAALGGITFALVAIACVIAFLVAVFLLMRHVVLWYWKVDEIVKNQKQQLFDQQEIIRLLQKQNELTERGNMDKLIM